MELYDLEDAAQIIGMTPKTLYRNFKRTQQNLKKKGILIMKWGEQKHQKYQTEYLQRDEDGGFINE